MCSIRKQRINYKGQSPLDLPSEVLTYYMPNPKPIAAIVPVPLKPESEYDSYDDLPVVEDFVSNLSELPDLDDFEHETLEIESDNDLPELEDFVPDSDEIPPLEDIPYGSPVPSNEPSRRIVIQYVQDQHSAEFAILMIR